MGIQMPKDHPVPKAGINMSGNLYIIRHGKTQWNEMHKLQGQVDIPLSGDGIKLAKEAAAKYRDVHFTALHSKGPQKPRKYFLKAEMYLFFTTTGLRK